MSKSLRQKIWYLHDIEGLTSGEIAEVLGIDEYDVVRVLRPNGY